MGKWARCPLCGHLRPARSFDRDHTLDTFNQVGLGRAKGFRYDSIVDLGLIDRIKNKIKFLYDKYFPTIKLAPGVRARGGVRGSGGVQLHPGIQTEPVVREI